LKLQDEDRKTISLSRKLHQRIAKLGTLGRDCTFADIVEKCVNIAEPRLLAEKHEY